MRPGQVERQKFEYIRRGTCSFIINFDVAIGQVVTPSYGATRTEGDFVNHVKHSVEADPYSTRFSADGRIHTPGRRPPRSTPRSL